MRRKHTVLAIDKLLQKIPIESIPILRTNSQSRIPSLHLLPSLLQKNVLVDPKSVYYVINPGGDLKNSQDAFEQDFKNRKWDGVAGKDPIADNVYQCLTKYDAYM